MNTERITFEGSQGFALAARLDMPEDGPPKACALFAHCFTCSKNLKAVTHISRVLAEQGVAVLRFDFTGLGQSEGDFSDTNFSSNVEDLILAAAYMEDRREAPAILIGHSLGGAAVLQAAHRLPSVTAVVTLGAPYDPKHVTDLLGDYADALKSRESVEVTLGGRKFNIKRQFIDDLEATEVETKIATLRRALLVLHSPIDATVGIDNAALIFQAAKHPKSFVSLDSADHLLTREEDSRYAGRVIGAWASRYVG